MTRKRRRASSLYGAHHKKSAAGLEPGAEKSQFFHKRHVHAAVWGIIGGLILLGAQIIWDAIKSPDDVYVTNQDTTAQIVVVSDSALRHLSEEMLYELRSLRRAQDSGVSNSERRSGAGGGTDASPWPMPKPLDSWYDLPASMHGIRHADISQFARVQCPPPVMFVGSVVPVRLSLLDGVASTRFSPLHVGLYEAIAGTDQNRLYFMQYPAQSREEVEVPLPTRPGMYVVEVGFFEWTSLEKARDGYAPFYRRACDIEVHERPA
jgi:hypothetical protein